MTDREELQRIARLVDANRRRMERIEEQMTRLESIMLEQGQVVRALRAVPDEGVEGAMVPLGAGVQIVVDMPADAGAVVDVGSGIQTERTRAEAANLIETRQTEVESLLVRLRNEFEEAERTVRSLATTFNEAVESMEDTSTDSSEVAGAPPTETAPAPDQKRSMAEDGGIEPDPEGENPKRRGRSRGFGGELTLDD